MWRNSSEAVELKRISRAITGPSGKRSIKQDISRFVSIRDISNNPAVFWEEDEAVITVNGKPSIIERHDRC